jgi:nucleoside-diphosphate-sugar epimerase
MRGDVLVTGSAGFLGIGATAAIAAAGWAVRAGVRVGPPGVATGDLVAPGRGDDAALAEALRGVTAVVHLAGLAHAKAGAEAHDAAHRQATVRLAQAAQAAGVTRFIYLSSAKAAGERSPPGRALTEADPPAPQTPYGVAKLAAEQALAAMADLRAVCLRPPLVHGPGVKANMAQLLSAAASAAPLPFGGLTAPRSLIARDSVAAAIVAVLAQSDGPAGAYFIADQPAYGVAEMVTILRAAWRRKPGLAPGWPLQLAARIRPGGALATLTEPFDVDPAAFIAAYGGFSAETSAAHLTRTAHAFRPL